MAKHWWNRPRTHDDEGPSAPPPPPRPETDAEMIARFRQEYRAKDRRDAEERRRQEKIDAEQQARRDRAQRELELRCIARNGAYFPGDLPGGPRARGVLQAFQDPGLREYQDELDDIWRTREREAYHASQGERQ